MTVLAAILGYGLVLMALVVLFGDAARLGSPWDEKEKEPGCHPAPKSNHLP